MSVSFSGNPQQQEFQTKNVQFLGSDNDSDFYLGGEDGGRSVSFYFPDAAIQSGVYPLAPEGDISAYYAVSGSLTWETLEGSIKVTSDLSNERVTIQFKFTAKEGGSGAGEIKAIGSGDFKGRTPWTQATRSRLECFKKQ